MVTHRMGRNLLASKINDLEDDGKQQGYRAPLSTRFGKIGGQHGYTASLLWQNGWISKTDGRQGRSLKLPSTNHRGPPRKGILVQRAYMSCLDRFASPSHTSTCETIHDWSNWRLKDAFFEGILAPYPTKDGLIDDKNPVADRLHRVPVPAELRGRDRGRLKS
jgi:hypothetical protein